MEVTRLLISILTFTFLVLIMIQHLKMIKDTNRHILHIYQLLDALYMGGSDPVASAYYSMLRKEGAYGNITEEKRGKMFDNVMAQEYSRIKKEISNQIKESNDPVEMARMEKAIDEVDNMFNLIGTIGPESSKEYLKQVRKEIELSKKKISGID